MSFVIHFFQRKKNSLFFLFLFSISISIYYHSNVHKNVDAIFNTISVVFSSYINHQFDKIKNYFFLQKQNELLIQENERLRKSLPSNFLASNTSKIETIDTIFTEDSTLLIRHFDFLAARTFNTSYNSNGQYIQLFRGENQGVTIGQGLVGSEGILGIIIKTTPNYSLAISLFNLYSKVSAQVSNKKIIGTISWDGNQYSTLDLKNISKTFLLDNSIKVGDTIVTSYYSDIFPENLPIGLIKEVKINNITNFLDIKILPFSDFSFITNTYVVLKISNNELNELK